jgi:hypothetical protein
MTEDLVERCKRPVRAGVKDWGKTSSDRPRDPGRRSTRMPMIQELVKELTAARSRTRA